MKILFYLIVVLSVAGCEGSFYYNLQVVNCRPDAVSDVTLEFGTIVHEKTLLDPDSMFGRLEERGPIPERAKISWVGKSGIRIERDFPVKDLLPSDFWRDHIVMQIHPDDTVRVQFSPGRMMPIRKGDWHRRAAMVDDCGRPVAAVQSPLSTGESGPKKDE